MASVRSAGNPGGFPRRLGTKLVYDGSFKPDLPRCLSNEELLAKICSRRQSTTDPDEEDDLVLLNRYFKNFRDVTNECRWNKYLSDNPAKNWWEESQVGAAPPCGSAVMVGLIRATSSTWSISGR
eukprot:768391-Hanusia_phi.AAC.2